MIRIWREPEVIRQAARETATESANEQVAKAIANAAFFETPLSDSFWLFRPQMNGYNVHDGICDEAAEADV